MTSFSQILGGLVVLGAIAMAAHEIWVYNHSLDEGLHLLVGNLLTAFHRQAFRKEVLQLVHTKLGLHVLPIHHP